VFTRRSASAASLHDPDARVPRAADPDRRLGKTNAIICMVAFSLMILIRNVATGIREVRPTSSTRRAAWA
jgi:ABC-type proline/glycine betaine transport system permease subunit